MHNQQNLCHRVLSKKPDIGFLGCQTNGTMMKLGSYTLPKEDAKNYESCDTPSVFSQHQHFFHWKSSNFVIS